ncbi:MAG: T9SS type B sorting domain-containing protein, partial [Muriicola sp.]|nr:T9SS type B sorting domain-containing protein [Muriicola sp.]NNK34717.1 T9SS type B sorting domain-containing protein [Eudoraea sp.]
ETALPLCTEDSNIITIVSPSSALTAAISEVANVTCTNDQGEILVDPSGGYPPYDIVLTNATTAQVYTVNGVNSYSFVGLSAGNFTVDITDAGGCVLSDTITLTQPALITADITATPTTLVCYGDTNATVTAINVVGGQGVYQYQLNYYDPTGTLIDFTSGGQISPVFDNLGAGIYSITVSDGWNCDVETVQVTISEPSDVESSLIEASMLTCTNNAQITLSATGGTGPYQYSTDNVVFSPMSGGNTHTFSVGAGVYQYYVRDSFGCEANISNQVSIDAVPPLMINLDLSAAVINCTGEATATIIADATGGLGNYQYELYSDAALSVLLAGPQASDTFSGLNAGSYYIRVTSGDCVEVTNEILITDPLPLQVDRQEFTNVTCAGEADGTITVEVSGGTGNILYAISPNLNQFDTVNYFDRLAPGVYDVIAQDVNGCFIPFQFTITEPAPVAATATAQPEICAGSEDGTITVNVSGGTAPYRTALNTTVDSAFVQDQFFYSDLAAGTYVVFIRDAQDCETNVIVEIEPGVNLNGIVEPVYECTGNIPDNYINITMDDPSVLGSIMYALDSTDPSDMQLNPDFTNIAPGSHYIAISHANGCVLTLDFEIDSFEPLTLVLEQNNINEITAIAAGGSPPYTFYFNDDDNGEDNTYYITETATHTVRVVDSLGCEMEAQIFMEFIDIEIPNFFTPDGDGMNDLWLPRNMEGFPEILIKIFDRYGREITVMAIDHTGWDGMYKGSELPTGDYWYVVKLNGERDDREFVGHFTLYR